MNLQENINRIKQVMGILNEQTNEVTIVTGEFTATGKITEVCDELHAFESICEVDETTKLCKPGTSKVVGGMHSKIGDKLYELHKNGINPQVTNVEVTVNDTTVSWKCTIKPSTDGKAWVGFTSRGAGCANVKDRAVSESEGKSPDKIKANINKVFGEEDRDFKMIKDFTHVGYGTNTFRQVFYIYTRPTKFPPHPSSQESKPVTSDSVETTSTTPTTPEASTGTQTNTLEPETSITPGATTTQLSTTATTEFKYPTIENPFKPTNGDPWEYAYDGTSLLVRNPNGSNKLFNLKDPNYFTTYLDSKLKTKEQVDKAIASIKNAYGDKLGMQ